MKLEKGEHELIFRDLPAGAVEGSIGSRAIATGKLEIGSVDTRRAFVPRDDAAASQSERRRLRTELEQRRDEKTVVQADIEAAETQKQLIANLAQLPTGPPVSGRREERRLGSVLGVIATATADAEKRRHEAEVKIREIDRARSPISTRPLRPSRPSSSSGRRQRCSLPRKAGSMSDVTIRYQVPMPRGRQSTRAP